MPATNALQPALSDEERDVVKSYGDWTNFSHSFGLKPYDDEDNAEAHAIASQMAQQEPEDNYSYSQSSSGQGK